MSDYNEIPQTPEILALEDLSDHAGDLRYAVEMSAIYKGFPGVQALSDVSLKVRPGTVHALMGENGAGKSTLMKILAGIYTPDSGTIVVEGRPVEIPNPSASLSLGISMIHQELTAVPERSVAENIFLGRELRNRAGLVSDKIMVSRSREIFDRWSIRINPKSKMSDLSVAQMQMVEIAKAISFGSRIIIMDEPTSAITEREVEHLHAMIRQLREAGTAIVYITHKMDEVFAISDEVTVFRDGQLVTTRPAKELRCLGNLVVVTHKTLVSGVLEMEALAELAGGKGNVVILQGDPANEAAVLRTQGCKDIVAKNPGMTVIKEAAGNWQRDKGQAIMEDWLQSGDQIDVVCANNDEMALGAINAIKAAGKLDSILVGGVDATADALAAMDAGELEVTVFQDASGQGSGGVAAAIKLLNGETVDSYVDIPYQLVTPANIADFKGKN